MQMLPGAPRVIYTAHSIEYDYGKQGITICFPACCCPKVTYRNSTPAARVVGHAVAKVAKKVHDLSERTGLSCLACKVKDETKGLACGAVDGVKTVGQAVLTPVVQVVQVLPGAKMLTASAQQRAVTARNDAVQRAASASAGLDETIATVR